MSGFEDISSADLSNWAGFQTNTPALYDPMTSVLNTDFNYTTTAGNMDTSFDPGLAIDADFSPQPYYTDPTNNGTSPSSSRQKHDKHSSKPREKKKKKCEADKNCDTRAADKRDMARHYWAYHRRYALEHGIPNHEGVCLDCGMEFTRSDNLTRHLNKNKCRPQK